TRRYRAGETEHEVSYRWTRQGLAADAAGVVHAGPALVVLETGGVRRRYEVARYDGGQVFVNGAALTELPRFPEPETRREPGSLLAPMPGTVVRVAEGLAVGSEVTEGRPLLWLEAMKMEHRVTAPVTGTLTALHAEPGRQVEVGALLAVVQAPPKEADRSADHEESQ
ncbi:acetyl-CoA carboxylase biotin carboxyl carrier protein subunit, partial [Streptomyces sp. UH6]|uniref:acetyl-CoA carboxylase biotin carboxyl carrier protein subunit n=1 Tax=Streptomyces sp. UH6 TaxID=2748379 RepID=UPI0015D4F33D